MIMDQYHEIPQVDFPFEISPVDRPEVEITSPHPVTSEPAAESVGQASNPIGFTAK